MQATKEVFEFLLKGDNQKVLVTKLKRSWTWEIVMDGQSDDGVQTVQGKGSYTENKTFAKIFDRLYKLYPNDNDAKRLVRNIQLTRLLQK